MTESRLPDARLPPPGHLLSFTAGFGVAMVACGGILAERLSRGNIRVALVAQLSLTAALLVVARSQGRAADRGIGASKAATLVVGAALGIVLAHSIVRASSIGTVPWLSERPAQFVNDAVAVFAPLAIVWASSRRPPNTLVLAATLILVTAYRATGFMWHLDAASFSYSVQDLVTGEFAGSALGVTAFRLLTPA
jgi:hypothetical protein